MPNDRTLVVERFRDELGDWRVVLHSHYGMQVHAPWALAVGARVTVLYGIDGATMANDDGIVVRIPETDGEPPGADLFVLEPDELDAIVTREVGGSALFASRFRECAARALLLPRYNPGRRSPLWQQRQRASQLLDVARKFPAFPIVLETVREVLQDVYDLPALTSLAKDIEARRIKIVETTTEDASPFARSLLFCYVGAFMYEGDSPLAERRAAALSLDAGLLSELLGRAELRELLDPAVIARTELELQRLAPDRRAKGPEGAADLLRILGPLDAEEVAARLEPDEAGSAADHLDALVAGRRALRVSFGGQPRVAAIEDASRLRDALGVPLPIGTPMAFVEPVADPLGDLVGRYARTHGPFTIADAATGIGLGSAVIADTLARLGAQRRVVEGEFRPGASGSEWCDVEVLRRLRSRSLAALRSEVEPVERAAYARFLPAWQHVAGADRERGLRGVDGVLQVIEQLAGAPVPASAWETLVVPARVRDYTPAMLDELTSTGEVIWSGAGTLAGADGWVSLHLADQVALTLPEPDAHDTDELQREILTTLGTGGGYFFRQLSDAVGSTDDTALVTALWDLVWAGLVTQRHPVAAAGAARGRVHGAQDAAAGAARAHVPGRADAAARHADAHGTADRGRALVHRAARRDRRHRARGGHGRAAAGALRRGHARIRDDRARARRIRAHLQGARRVRGHGTRAPGLLHRDAGRCAVLHGRHGRPAARVHPGSGRGRAAARRADARGH